MSEINSVNGMRVLFPPATDPAPARPQPEHHEPDAQREEDRVEISEAGSTLAQMHDNGRIRVEKVARIRSEIQNGLYDVNSKLGSIVDRILEDISG